MSTLSTLDWFSVLAGFNREALLAARSDERTCARSVALVWLLGFVFHGAVFYVMGLQFSLSEMSAIAVALLAAAMIGYFDRVIIIGTNRARASSFAFQQKLSSYSLRESSLRVVLVMVLRMGCIVVLINMVSTTLPPVMFSQWMSPEFNEWQKELDADLVAEATLRHDEKGVLLDEQLTQLKASLNAERNAQATQAAQEQATHQALLEENRETLRNIALLEEKLFQQKDSLQAAEQLMVCETHGSATQACKKLGASAKPTPGKNYHAAVEQKRLANQRIDDLNGQITLLKSSLYVPDKIDFSARPLDGGIAALEIKLAELIDKKNTHISSQTTVVSESVERNPQRILLDTEDPATQWKAINRLKEKDPQFSRNFLAMELTAGFFECLVFALVLISPMGNYHFNLARLIVQDLIKTHTESAYLHQADVDVRQQHRRNVEDDTEQQFADRIWKTIKRQYA